jgi:hypothetical protein
MVLKICHCTTRQIFRTMILLIKSGRIMANLQDHDIIDQVWLYNGRSSGSWSWRSAIVRPDLINNIMVLKICHCATRLAMILLIKPGCTMANLQDHDFIDQAWSYNGRSSRSWYYWSSLVVQRQIFRSMILLIKPGRTMADLQDHDIIDQTSSIISWYWRSAIVRPDMINNIMVLKICHCTTRLDQ